MKPVWNENGQIKKMQDEDWIQTTNEKIRNLPGKLCKNGI